RYSLRCGLRETHLTRLTSVPMQPGNMSMTVRRTSELGYSQLIENCVERIRPGSRPNAGEQKPDWVCSPDDSRKRHCLRLSCFQGNHQRPRVTPLRERQTAISGYLDLIFEPRI